LYYSKAIIKHLLKPDIINLETKHIPSPTNESWLEFIEGNNNSLSVVYQSFHAPLFYTAFYYLKDEDAANDIINDIFLKLLEMSKKDRIHILSGVNEKLEVYLKVMVKNRCLDKINIEKNRSSIRNGIIGLFNRYSYNNGTEESDYLELVSVLPEQQKIIFELHIEGYDNQAIADDLGISYNTVRNTLSTSKKKLRILWSQLME